MRQAADRSRGARVRLLLHAAGTATRRWVIYLHLFGKVSSK
jgi:hypothetical protein